MAYKQPDKNGFYGRFGGRFVPETLMTAVLELEEAYRESQADPSFQAELDQLLKQYVGRETPLYYAKNLTKYVGGARSFLKEKTQPHRAHKINNALGQVLLAHRMGKKKIIAETGAGQHGVATERQLLYLIWNAPSTWGKKMSNAKPSMSFGWSYWAPRFNQ